MNKKEEEKHDIALMVEYDLYETIKSNIKFSTELIRMQIDSVNYQKLLLNSFINPVSLK